MKRKEEIIARAKEAEKETTFSDIVLEARGVCSAFGIGYLEGADWADHTMIDKACEWLKDNLLDYWQQKVTNEEYFIENFRNAMEE